MIFNPDINKQVQEVIFSPKLQKLYHAFLKFNGTSFTESQIQKHLGMFLDSKLDFKKNITNMINKASNTKGLLSRLQKLLPRLSLITIYKYFIWSHLDYEDIIYSKAYNVSFHQSLEFIQYLAAIVIIGSTRRLLERRYTQNQVLNLAEAEDGIRNFYKVSRLSLLGIYSTFIPAAKRAYITRNNDKQLHFKVRRNYFKKFFFPSIVIE